MPITCELGRRGAGDLEKGRRVEPEPARENQPFGKRQAMQAEDEIDREFRPAAVADPADVKAPREQRIEHGCGVVCDPRVAADEAQPIACTHLRTRTRHRHFEKPQGAGDARAKRRDPVRIASRGADHDLAGGERQQRALDDILDLIGREHRKHDRLAVPRDVGERCRAHADLRHAICLGRIDVVSDDGKARGEETGGIDLAHQAEADEADGRFF